MAAATGSKSADGENERTLERLRTAVKGRMIDPGRLRADDEDEEEDDEPD